MRLALISCSIMKTPASLNACRHRALLRSSSFGPAFDARHPLDRRGVAPLEFVLFLPIFIALFAGLLHVSGAMFVRLKAIEVTRFQTWKAAADIVPGQQLNLVQPVMDGESHTAAVLPFDWGRSWRNSRGTAESETTVLNGTWDYVSLPFDETSSYHMDLYPAVLMLTHASHPSGNASMLTSYALQMRRLQQVVAR